MTGFPRLVSVATRHHPAALRHRMAPQMHLHSRATGTSRLTLRVVACWPRIRCRLLPSTAAGRQALGNDRLAAAHFQLSAAAAIDAAAAAVQRPQSDLAPDPAGALD